ncbi:MAG: hypothetical protein WC307_07210 [Candidatus Nanoarchaeia archaeon]|jgi:hypothetical protein
MSCPIFLARCVKCGGCYEQLITFKGHHLCVDCLLVFHSVRLINES